MPVPEAAVNKDHSLILWQYNIRFTRQVLYVQAVAKTVGMQKLSYQHFRFGILTLYAAHVITARFLAVHVCHTIKLVSGTHPLQICEYLPLPMCNRGTGFVRTGSYMVAVATVVKTL